MNELDEIQNEIELFYNLPKDWFWQDTRKREVVTYRNLFFYLRFKLLNNYTYSYVSEFVRKKGLNKNHATQINSKKSIEDLIYFNIDNLANDVKYFEEKLKHLKGTSFAKILTLNRLKKRIIHLEQELKEAKQKKKLLAQLN